ncbi:DsbA family oxidoreductase [Arcobacteraceae bacterium]|nr:DsbA family oxidoreductase [Arcobacteraceae bacterium]
MKKIILAVMMILGLVTTLNADINKEKIKIDIVSDVVCPWCAIGYKRLSKAIEELNLENHVEVVWHPFELNPNMPSQGQNANEYLMNKLRLSKGGLIKKRQSVTALGAETGFKFDYFAKMKKVNTFNAHVLLDYAKEFGKQTELKVRLQQAYFGERKDINDFDVLYNELERVGLNASEAMKRLDDKKSIQRVKDEEKYWKSRGVYAIPTMVFDNSIVRQGANQVEVYKELLTQLMDKRK